jgi:GDP-mannose 4,6-dehydratase
MKKITHNFNPGKLFKCQICNSKKLVPIISLGDQPLANTLLNKKSDEKFVKKYPLNIVACKDCTLLQLDYIVDQNKVYHKKYPYLPGITKQVDLEQKEFADDVLKKISLKKNDLVIDIGSNDSTLLQSYKKHLPDINLNLYGIDPTGTQFKEYYPNYINLIPDFFNYQVVNNNLQNNKAKIITSICMFYDLPDPLQFVKDIKQCLSDDGIWVSEQSYLMTMLAKNSFDTICHEHLEYYNLQQILWLCENSDMKLIDVKLNESNGGSFRTFITHKNSKYAINVENINKLLEYEKSLEIKLQNFVENSNIVCKNIYKFISSLYNPDIYIYGASTKGNTLLQYIDNINNSNINKYILCASERNPEKWGRKTPGTNIPIVSEKRMREYNPQFLFALPWHFKNEFLQRESEYLNNGGQIIFPLPNLEIIKNKKCAFVTGGTGQIASYLIDILLSNNYIVYATYYNTFPIKTNKNPTDSLTRSVLYKNLIYIKCDITNYNDLKFFINLIKPNEIYNYGSITDTLYSFEHPLDTLNINANTVLYLCEILKTNKNIKMFQASSSELFNNQINITENNEFSVPITPYSIGKFYAHTTIEYYKNKYNLFICNGYIYNTESPLRKNKYVVKKVCNYVKYLLNNFTENIQKLKLGNLNNKKDWIHAYDVANASYLILQQSTPDNYNISRGITHSIEELVKLSLIVSKIESNENFDIYKYIDIDTSLQRNFESKIENKIGDNTKLKNIGWTLKYPTLTDILNDIIYN